MTSRTLSLTINCPEWCDESPLQHLEGPNAGGGALPHTHSMGKITTTLGQDVRDDEDILKEIEVTLERFDCVTARGVKVGSVAIRLGGDELYPVDTARELARLLLATADVLDGVSPVGDTTGQVLAEQAVVAEQS